MWLLAVPNVLLITIFINVSFANSIYVMYVLAIAKTVKTIIVLLINVLIAIKFLMINAQIVSMLLQEKQIKLQKKLQGINVINA